MNEANNAGPEARAPGRFQFRRRFSSPRAAPDEFGKPQTLSRVQFLAEEEPENQTRLNAHTPSLGPTAERRSFRSTSVISFANAHRQPGIPIPAHFHSAMSSVASSSHSLSEVIDIVNTALETFSRRLPVYVSRDDLASAGKLALVAAINQVQGSISDVRAYCFVRVRGAMFDELRRLDPLSRGHREKLTLVIRAQSELSARLGRAATRAEIVAATGLAFSDVVRAETILAQQSELAETDLDSLPDVDAPSPAERAESDDLRLNLRSALSRLGCMQAAVLYRYYFDGTTLEAIATDLGVSKERVRQIREAGEKKLRDDFGVLAIWQALIDRG